MLLLGAVASYRLGFRKQHELNYLLKIWRESFHDLFVHRLLEIHRLQIKIRGCRVAKK